jgi:tetratricopeptide (TPR) repeat protein
MTRRPPFAAILLALVIPSITLGGNPRLARLDSLWSSGIRDSAAVLTRSLLKEARASGDTDLQIDLLTRAGQQNRFFGRVVEGERDLREATAMAFAAGDSSRAVAALRWLGLVIGIQGRVEESRRLYDSLLVLSTRIGDLRHQGWARIGLAWFAGQEGRGEEAVAHYRAALSLFHECGDSDGEIWALSGLGRALTSRGMPKAAMTCYRRAADLGRARGDPIAEANAINDLATIEFSLGDPGVALGMFERALAIHRKSGSLSETVSPSINIALCHSTLEQYAEAESVLGEALQLCREREYQSLAVVVGIHRAKLSERRWLLHESATRYLEILRHGEALSLRNHVNAMTGLAEVLLKSGNPTDALPLLEEAAGLLAGEEERVLIPALRILMTQALLALGRFDGALRQAELGAEAAERFGQLPQRVEAMADAGRACRAMDRPAEARKWFLAAADGWEEQRGVPLDPLWREQRGALGQVVYSDLASLLIEDCPAGESGGGARAAFDRLQAFKARTLLERMLGPGESESSEEPTCGRIIAATEIQERVLHPGEIFLDYYLGPESSYLFALASDTLRAVRLPPAPALQEKMLSYYQLVSRPPSSRREGADAVPLDRAAQRLAQTLFGEVDSMIRDRETVMVSADGLLALLPLEEIYRHLDSPPRDTDRSVVPAWVRIPSASILAELRAASRREASDPASVLVIAGGKSAAGEILHGSLQEARNLGWRYRGVEVRTAGDMGDSVCVLPHPAEVIHIAAHLFLDDASPWRSEIRFGPKGAPANPSAARIATLELPARLAVLSSCSSASGRVVSGEGVIGVTSAFMSAGVPSVVATLWAVDDRTTEALMERFYERLARGDPVAAALASAKGTIRADPATRAPFYWAGFVVVGEGDATFALRPRFDRGFVRSAGLVLIGGAGILILLFERRRRARR